MTKLQQTIKVKVHSVMGKTEEEIKATGGGGYLSSVLAGRACGRTTAILLKAIAEAQLVAAGGVGNVIIEDHYHINSNSKTNAEVMRAKALCLIEKLGLNGFDVKVVSTNGTNHRFGIHITFNTWTEAIYDLRK